MAEGDIPAFPGPRPFSRAENGRFFGRTAEAARLVAEWRQSRLTFLTGPAGIGKTSLLTAGVLPFVEADRGTVSLLPIGGLGGLPHGRLDAPAPTRCPVAALKDHNPYALSLLRSWSGAAAATRLAGMPVDDFLREYAQNHPDKLTLAAIDQADDLFAGPDDEDRDALRRRFLGDLDAALAALPGLRLLVTIRDDCAPRFAEGLRTRGAWFELHPLTLPNAHDAVSKPGFFAADAATELVGSLRTSRLVDAQGKEWLVSSDEVEPALLQVACAGLWQSLRAHAAQITADELERFQELTVDSALTGYCSAAIAAVAAIHHIPVAWLRNWLVRTFVTEVGDLAAAPEGQPETAGAPTSVARALEDRYLLRGHQPDAPETPGSRIYRLLSQRLVEPLRRTLTLADREPAPPTADHCLRAAERAFVTGDLDHAARLAGLALTVAAPTDLRRHAEAQTLIGDVHYKQGYLDNAETAYRTARQLYQAASDQAAVGRLCAAIARTLSDRGKFAEALQELAAAVARVPDLTLQDELVEYLAIAAQQTASIPPFRRSPG